MVQMCEPDSRWLFCLTYFTQYEFLCPISCTPIQNKKVKKKKIVLLGSKYDWFLLQRSFSICQFLVKMWESSSYLNLRLYHLHFFLIEKGAILTGQMTEKNNLKGHTHFAQNANTACLRKRGGGRLSTPLWPPPNARILNIIPISNASLGFRH